MYSEKSGGQSSRNVRILEEEKEFRTDPTLKRHKKKASTITFQNINRSEYNDNTMINLGRAPAFGSVVSEADLMVNSAGDSLEALKAQYYYFDLSALLIYCSIESFILRKKVLSP